MHKLYLRILLLYSIFFFSTSIKGQTQGLFIRNLERTLTDSTQSILVKETGRLYNVADKKIIERVDGNKSVSYEYFELGKRTNHFKKGIQYRQDILIDSIKFRYFKYAYFDNDNSSFPFESYIDVYKSILSSIDSIGSSHIYQITTTMKKDQPLIEIEYFNLRHDTIFQG